MDKLLTETSKFLSYVLRHEPQAIGLVLDSEGWGTIADLLAGARQTGRVLDEALIRRVVEGNNKQRFAISADGLRIRAVQGHSAASVAMAYPEQIPPEWLFHGTATRFLPSILAQGLLPGQRHHVHLSSDVVTATAVGQRHGQPVVLRVAALAMHQQGFKFWLAENGVWLSGPIPPMFLAAVSGGEG